MNARVNERIKVELLKKFEGNVWKPGYLTEIDSDPRWRTLDLIEATEKKEIVWEWENTDFTNIGGEPIVVEFSTTIKDEIKQKEGLAFIKLLCGAEYKVIEGEDLIVILNQKAPTFKYGMKLRGFSMGAQPMEGFIKRHDDPTNKYYDILEYSIPLGKNIIEAYSLEEIKPTEE